MNFLVATARGAMPATVARAKELSVSPERAQLRRDARAHALGHALTGRVHRPSASDEPRARRCPFLFCPDSISRPLPTKSAPTEQPATSDALDPFRAKANAPPARAHAHQRRRGKGAGQKNVLARTCWRDGWAWSSGASQGGRTCGHQRPHCEREVRGAPHALLPGVTLLRYRTALQRCAGALQGAAAEKSLDPGFPATWDGAG